jgi:hypothetical protein
MMRLAGVVHRARALTRDRNAVGQGRCRNCKYRGPLCAGAALKRSSSMADARHPLVRYPLNRFGQASCPEIPPP